MSKAATFAHLHVHSEYSLVDGLARIQPLVRQCVEFGMPALALTDLSNMFAMIKFYRAARAAGVKPIIGAECMLAGQAAGHVAVDEAARIVLLCQNQQGYRNLTELISRGYIDGQTRGAPMLQKAWLSRHHDGLIALSAAREGDIGRALRDGDTAEAEALLRSWKDIFGDRFYLEVTRTERPGEEQYIHACVDLAAATATPVVATNDVRFLEARDFAAHEARVCIAQGRVLDDSRRAKNCSARQYLRSSQEMLELFADLPEAIENACAIAERCNLELSFEKNYLPDFPIPGGLSAQQYLVRQAEAGLRERLAFLRESGGLGGDEAVYHERLKTELAVISGMGFAGYFLIVADFIRWAKDNHVPVGPGRGSGAGSLVAYALGITDLDPIFHDLLFERFLNPERVSMPDFDIDFCMDGRDRVIDYVSSRYGSDKVSQIITYGSMAARGVVRDVARVLGYAYKVGDRIARLVPHELGMTLDKALDGEPDLRKLYEEDEEARNVIDLAKPLEGLVRNPGKHAGGVVIAPSALTEFTPLYCEQGGGPVTQLDKDDIESIGLVKFDFLGLRTLTIIDWALQNVAKLRGEEIAINRIDGADKATFDLLKACNTTAVFQLESRGMKDLIKRLQPDCFEDIVALVALFRPGPLQSGMVDDFINRKHGRAMVQYPHPALQPVLKPTYGVIVYQEQVMQIAQVLAGYTLGGADILRRAMGKKKPEEMAKQRDIFTAGALKNGVPKAQANAIFDLIDKFAGYGFNKSHSAAYALLAYQTAWLKANYPSAFMAAVLSADMSNTDKMSHLVNECREMGLEIRPPSINDSDYRFVPLGEHAIGYGLGAIKGVGKGVVEDIVAQRGAGGPYKDMTDLCMRHDLSKLNRGILQIIIRAGATDCLDKNRAALLHDMPGALQLADQRVHNAKVGQNDMFGLAETAVPAAPMPAVAPTAASASDARRWSKEQQLRKEKEALGLYLTGHPIDRVEWEVEKIVTHRLKDINALAAADIGNNGENGGGQSRKQPALVAGLISNVRRHYSKRGRMAEVLLDDKTGQLEITLFSDVFSQFGASLEKDSLIFVEGDFGLDSFSGNMRLTAKNIMTPDEARAKRVDHLLLEVDSDTLDRAAIESLARALSAHRGDSPVRLQYKNQHARARMRLGENWRVRPTEDLLQNLRETFGERRVRWGYKRGAQQ